MVANDPEDKRSEFFKVMEQTPFTYLDPRQEMDGLQMKWLMQQSAWLPVYNYPDRNVAMSGEIGVMMTPNEWKRYVLY